MAELRTILFDLDGTLVRAREASWDLFRQTNEKFGLGVDTPSAFFRLFDKNFYAALDKASGDSGSAGDVRRHFQTLLRTQYSPEFIPGMAQVVRSLAAHYTLIVLSSNTMEALRRILLANGVAHCFAHVFSGDVTPSKHDAIARFLDDASYSCGRRCSPHYEEGTPPRRPSPAEAMLITDTVGDVGEARQAGIRVGAVAWGMHHAGDLERAGAEFVCIWPEELVAYLSPGEICATGACHLPSGAVEGPLGVPPESQAASAGTHPPVPAPAPAAVVPPARPRPQSPPEVMTAAAAVRRERRVRAARALAGGRDPAQRPEPRSALACSCGGPRDAMGPSLPEPVIPGRDPVLRRAIELTSGANPIVSSGQHTRERLSPSSVATVSLVREESSTPSFR